MANKDHIFVLGKEAIVDVKHIATSDPDTIKLVIRSTERMKDAYVVINNVDYPAFTNLDEPYDFRVHGFYVPRSEITANPRFVIHMTGNAKTTNLLREPGLRCCVPLVYDPSEETTADFEFEKDDSRYKASLTKDTQVADGLTFRYLECVNKDDQPVKLFLLVADPKKIGFELAVTGDGKPYENKKTDAEGNVISSRLMYPIATIEEMAKEAIANGLDVCAATNADFFDMFGDNHPSGLSVKCGEVLSNPDSARPFFGVLDDGTPVISSFADNPEYKGKLKFAVGGSHIMSKNGEPGDFAFIEPFGFTRHPRTAVGICEDGKILVLVVDGRLPHHSNGATLVDLALTLKQFGAVDSINLDGGGSSIMLLRPDGEAEFERQNTPADLHRPTECLIRPGYNGILLYRK